MSALTSPAKRRGSYGVLDQVFSSVSNGLILFAIAVVSTAEEFGLISLLLILLTAGVGCMRGALGTPLLLKAADGTEQIRREGSYAVTAALAVCPPLVGGMWLLLKGRELGTPIILVAIATPVVMVQDVLRYVVISEGRPHVAAIWDGFWLLGSVGLLVSTWAGTRFVDADVLIAGWSVLAAAALVGLAINPATSVPRLIPMAGHRLATPISLRHPCRAGPGGLAWPHESRRGRLNGHRHRGLGLSTASGQRR